MTLSRNDLLSLLQVNVVELRFNRRRPKSTHPYHRRMLCTNDVGILTSKAGMHVFRYKAPTQSLRYDPKAKNLVVTWDILFQDWRAIPCESLDVISVVSTKKEDVFWKFVSDVILPLTPLQKSSFINK